MYLIRDGEHEVGPEGHAAGGGEKVHGAEKGLADFLPKEVIENSAHFAIQLTGDGEHFPVVCEFFSRRADFLLEGIQLGEGAGEAFEEVHVGGIEGDRHLPGEEIFLHAGINLQLSHAALKVTAPVSALREAVPTVRVPP